MQSKPDNLHYKPSTQEVLPPVTSMERISSHESEELFSSISFQDFILDLKGLISTSNLDERRIFELTNNIDTLIERLKQGFELNKIKVLFMEYVDFDINNNDEKDIFNYFVHSIKVLYEKYRMVHPINAHNDIELSTSP